MILALYTDNPNAEITLFAPDGTKLHNHSWLGERRLAKELLGILLDELAKAGGSLSALTGVVVYKGPGSFTGLRIGITTANTIAYALGIPIVGTEGNDWMQKGIGRIQKGETDHIVLPHYGLEANISTPKR